MLNVRLVGNRPIFRKDLHHISFFILCVVLRQAAVERVSPFLSRLGFSCGRF